VTVRGFMMMMVMMMMTMMSVKVMRQAVVLVHSLQHAITTHTMC